MVSIFTPLQICSINVGFFCKLRFILSQVSLIVIWRYVDSRIQSSVPYLNSPSAQSCHCRVCGYLLDSFALLLTPRDYWISQSLYIAVPCRSLFVFIDWNLALPYFICICIYPYTFTSLLVFLTFQWIQILLRPPQSPPPYNIKSHWIGCVIRLYFSCNYSYRIMLWTGLSYKECAASRSRSEGSKAQAVDDLDEVPNITGRSKETLIFSGVYSVNMRLTYYMTVCLWKLSPRIGFERRGGRGTAWDRDSAIIV